MERIRFGEVGVLRGIIGRTVTVEQMVGLGGVFAKKGTVALGWSGGDGAAMLARALGAGICAAGGRVLVHDGCRAAIGSWVGSHYDLAESVFLEQEGEWVYLHRFGRDGLSPGWEENRSLERSWREGCFEWEKAGRIGQWETVVGVNTACAADAARWADGRSRGSGASVAVPGEGSWDQVLAHSLEQVGCHVLRSAADGVPVFSSSHGGFWLEGRAEDGLAVEPIRLLTLTAALELERGRDVAVPIWAPAVLEEVAGDLGRKVYRLDRDKCARQLYAQMPQLRNALFGAVYLAAAMSREGRGLSELLSRLPSFALRRIEIPLQRRSQDVVEELTRHFRCAEPVGEGVRLQAGGGWVTVSPVRRCATLRLQTEGESAEVAQELCGFYEEELRRLDSGRR